MNPKKMMYKICKTKMAAALAETLNAPLWVEKIWRLRSNDN